MDDKVKELRGARSVKIPDRMFDMSVCQDMNNLHKFLSAEELEFFRAYLLDFDIFSTIIEHNYGESGWADICFATAKALYKILTDDKSMTEHTYYNRGHTHNQKLHNILTDTNNVVFFEIDGHSEGHGFVVYPVTSDKVYLIQSAGGIMTANMRILSTTDFIHNLQLLTTSNEKSGVADQAAAAQYLFGYYMKDNIVNKLTYCYAHKLYVSLKLLEQYLTSLSAEQVLLLQKAFDNYFEDFDIASDIELATNIDLEKPDDFIFSKSKLGPYYFVDPVKAEWRCVSTAAELPHSTVSIGIRHAACYRLRLQHQHSL